MSEESLQDRLKGAFIEEAKENLTIAEDQLLRMSRGELDPDGVAVLQKATASLAETSEAQLDAVRGRLASLRAAFHTSQEEASAELKKTEAAANALRDCSHQVIQHLQFQDRANQLLLHARDQVDALEEVLGVREAPSPATAELGGGRERGVVGRGGERDVLLTPGRLGVAGRRPPAGSARCSNRRG